MEFEDFEDPFDESDEDANDIPSLIHKYGGKPEEIKMVHKDPDSIRMIDAETFNRDINIVDNETLTYYQEDGVLVDAANNVIKNEEEVIGSKLMDEIFDCPESDEYFYVINDDEEKMYEVVVEHNQSFYRDIMGDMND